MARASSFLTNAANDRKKRPEEFQQQQRQGNSYQPSNNNTNTKSQKASGFLSNLAKEREQRSYNYGKKAPTYSNTPTTSTQTATRKPSGFLADPNQRAFMNKVKQDKTYQMKRSMGSAVDDVISWGRSTTTATPGNAYKLAQEAQDLQTFFEQNKSGYNDKTLAQVNEILHTGRNNLASVDPSLGMNGAERVNYINDLRQQESRAQNRMWHNNFASDQSKEGLPQNQKKDAEDRLDALRRQNLDLKRQGRLKGFEQVQNATDFADRSQYRSTATGRQTYGPYGNQSENGFGDLTYDLVNKNPEAIKSRFNTAYGASEIEQRLGTDDEELQRMTEDEVKTFNYLYSRDRNQALAYLEDLKPDLRARQSLYESGIWSDKTENNFALTSLESVPLRYIGALDAATAMTIDKLAGKDLDTNAGYLRNWRISNAIRGTGGKMAGEWLSNLMGDITSSYFSNPEVNEEVKKQVQNRYGHIAEKFGETTYGAVMSALDQLWNLGMSGGNQTMSLVLMSSSAVPDTIVSAKERGLSDKDAIGLGVIAGVAEYFTEKVSLEALLDMESIAKNGFFKYVAKAGLAEGSEEVAADFINLVAEEAIAGDKSQFQQAVKNYERSGMSHEEAVKAAWADQVEQSAFSFFGGAIAGTGMAVGFGGANQIAEAQEARAGRRIKADNPDNAMIQRMGDAEVARLVYDQQQAAELERRGALAVQQAADQIESGEEVDPAITEYLMSNANALGVLEEQTGSQEIRTEEDLNNALREYADNRSKIETESTQEAQADQTQEILKQTETSMPKMGNAVQGESVARQSIPFGARETILKTDKTDFEIEQNRKGVASAAENFRKAGYEVLAHAIEQNYNDNYDVVKYNDAVQAIGQAAIGGKDIPANTGLPVQSVNEIYDAARAQKGVTNVTGETGPIRVQRNAGRIYSENTGGQTGIVGESTAETQGRGTSGQQTRVVGNNTFRLSGESVTAKSIGIPNGTDATSVHEVVGGFDSDMQEAQSKAARRGLDIHFFVGDNLSTGKRKGDTRGLIFTDKNGRKQIWVRADHPVYSPLEITLHELYHDGIDREAARLAASHMDNYDKIRKQVVNARFRQLSKVFDEKTINFMFDSYKEFYEGMHEIPNRGEAISYIKEELLSDMAAGMNEFNKVEGLEKIPMLQIGIQSVLDVRTGEFREQLEKEQTEETANETRGPPQVFESMDVKFSSDTERTFIDRFSPERTSRINAKIESLNSRGKYVEIDPNEVSEYQIPNTKKSKDGKKFLKNILSKAFGNKNVVFEINNNQITAYLTREGKEHFNTFNELSKENTAIANYVRDIILKAEYLFSNPDDGHSEKIEGVEFWDKFVSLVKIGNDDYSVIFSLRKMDSDIRHQIYAISAKKEGTGQTADADSKNPRIASDMASSPSSENNVTQPSENDNTKFGMKQSVETVGNLVAVHNIFSNELEKALKLGGFPMPSIAITKAEMGHAKFGDVSMVFGKETIDPQANRANKVYSGDAWTPEYPSIAYEANSEVEEKASDLYYDVYRKYGDEIARPMYRAGVSGLDDLLNRAGGAKNIIDDYLDDTQMMNFYLAAEKGSPVEPILTTEEERMTDTEVRLANGTIKVLGSEAIEDLSNAEGIQRLRWMESHEDEIFAVAKEYFKGDRFTDEEVEDIVNGMKKIEIWRSFLAPAVRVYNNDTVTRRTERDSQKEEEAIRKAVDKKEYEKWLNDLFANAEASRGIYNGSDWFTPSGKRRSFKQTHWPETLDNVVRAMKNQGEQGIGAFGNNILGAAPYKYESLNDIREDAERRLKRIDDDEIDRLKKEYHSRFSNIVSELPIHKDSFHAYDDAAAVFTEAIQKYKTRDAIANYIRKEGKGWMRYSDEAVDEFLDLVNDIRSMPTTYFEAKPQRAIRFNEVKAALVPTGTTQDVVKQLKDAGVQKVVRYKKGDDADRLAKLNSIPNVKFSREIDSEGNRLSEAQQRFFADSQVRDEDGNLLLVYHGTPSGGFTVFRPASYFTANQDYANVYQNAGASSISYGKTADNPMTYAGYLNITKPFDTRIPEIRKIFEEQYYRKYGTGTPLMDSGLPDWVDGLDLVEFIEENDLDFDGLILDEGGVPDGNGGVISRGLSYVPLSSNQFKDKDNLNPTENPDIHFSREIDSKYLAAVESGDMETAQRMVDEAARKAGYTYRGYHGTAKEFTVFDKERFGRNWGGDSRLGPGFYFAHDKETASRWTDGTRVVDAFLSMKNPLDLRKETPENIVDAIEKKAEKSLAEYDLLKAEMTSWTMTREEYASNVERIKNNNLDNVAGFLNDYKYDNEGKMTDGIHEFLSGLEYDGIISDQEIVVFEPNQIKDASPVTYDDNGNVIPLSERFNTENNDIRYSREVNFSSYLPEDLQRMAEAYDELEAQYNELRKENRKSAKRASYFKGETKLNVYSQNPQVSMKAAEKIAKGYVRDLRLGMDTSELARKIKKYAEEYQTGKKTFSELADDVLPIANEMARSAKVLIDSEEKDLINQIRGTKIKVSDTIRNDIPDYGQFRKQYFGRVMLSALDGTPVEDVYRELQDSYGMSLFPDDVMNPTDQLYVILNALDTLEPQREEQMFSSYDMAEATQSIAFDIMQDVMGMQMHKTFADKQKEERAKLKREMQEKAQKALKEVRKQRDDRIKQLKDHYKEVAERKRIRREEAADRKKLLKIAQRLSRIKTTKATRALIDELIGDLDLVAVSITSGKVQDLKGLKEWYESQFDDPDFLRDTGIEKAISRLEKKQISDMDIEDVRELTNILKAFEHKLRTDNKLINEQDRRDVFIMGQEIIDHISGSKGVRLGKLDDIFIAGTLTPERAIHRMTDYWDEDPLYLQTKALSKGQRDMINYQMAANDMFKEWTSDRKFLDNEMGKKAEEIELAPGVFITPAMRMSLYLHAKNDDNMRHIEFGGVRVPDMKLYKKGDMKEAYAKGKLVQLTRSQINRLADGMSAMEKAAADAIYDYFNRMSQESINAVSEDLYGYSLAEVENYFPINTDKNYTKSSDTYQDFIADSTIEGMGFLKSRIQAKNPIMLRDSFEVLMQSINDTSRFVGLAIPVRNFKKLMNVQLMTFDEGGNATGYETSVKDEIGRNWRTKGQRYINNMLADLEGNARKGALPDELNDFLNKVRSNYAGAVLTLNLSVAMKQAASYPTAASVLGWGPLVKAMGNTRLSGKVDLDLIKKYTPLLYYRMQGYSTQELGDIKQSNNFMNRLLSKHKALNWIQAVDIATTKKLWKASEYYVRDNFKDQEVGTDEYYKQVADVYNKVIEETQPNYTTMQRPDVLRNNNALIQSILMFKTQPFQNFNVLYDAIGNYQAKVRHYNAMAGSGDTAQVAKALNERNVAKKKLGNAVSAMLVSTLVFAAMTFAYNMLRRKKDNYSDEEGNMDAQGIARGIGKDMAASLAGTIPFGSEAWELISSLAFGDKYYGLNSVTIEALSNFAETTTNIFKELNDIIHTPDKTGAYWQQKRVKLGKYANTIASAFGVPFENVSKLISVITGWALQAKGKTLSEFYNMYIQQGPTDQNKKQYVNLLLDAYKTGDVKAYQEMYDVLVHDEALATSKMDTASYIADKIKPIEKERAKQSSRSEAGITAAESKKYDKLLTKYDEDSNGTYTQQEVYNALMHIDLTMKQKETLWNENGWKKSYSEYKPKK